MYKEPIYNPALSKALPHFSTFMQILARVGLDLDTGWRLHNALLTLGLIWINPPSLRAGPATTGRWSALRSTSWTDKGTIELQLHHCAACTSTSHCTDCTLQPSQPNVTEKFCWIQCNHPPSDSIIYVSPLGVSAWRQMTCDVRLMLQYSIPGCGQEGDTINTKQRGSMHGKMKFTALPHWIIYFLNTQHWLQLSR